MKIPDTSRLQFDSKKHAYSLDGKKLLSGVTTVISETSSKSALIQWAANMAVDYIKDNSTSIEKIHANNPEDDAAAFMATIMFKGHVFTSPEILEKARTAHARKRDGAATKGTDTHALVEQFILDQINHKIGTDWPKEIESFITWAVENDVKFIAAEQRLYSEKHGYAGTCDFMAMIDGKLTIGDLKTFPKMWSADAFIQMGAYSLAWTELTGERPLQSVVVKMCDPNDERLKKYGGKAFAVYPRYALEEDEEMFLTRLKMYRYNENFISPKE